MSFKKYLKNKILKISRLLYIYFAKYRVNNLPYSTKGDKILKKLRICFLKQETYNDLYTDPNLRNSNLLYSTIHRSGPIGLFDASHFDFKIVRLTQSEESRAWQHLEMDVGGDSYTKILTFKDILFQKKSGAIINKKSQSSVAINSEDIDWRNYDVVISINFSVDQDIVLKNPDVLWCYMPQEPSLRHYKWSSRKPLYSYDIFLNQQFSFHLKKEIKRFLQISKSTSHEIDFPYNFMSSKSFKNIKSYDSSKRSGVYIENHSLWHIKDEELNDIRKFGNINHPKEEPYQAILLKMLDSKYFFSLRNNNFKIWGNSIIDAIGAGLLSFGNPEEYLNIALFTPFTSINRTVEFIDKIKFLEKNSSFYLKEIGLQTKLLDKYCYYNPIKNINKAVLSKRKRLLKYEY
jgi:hypothetical protein